MQVSMFVESQYFASCNNAAVKERCGQLSYNLHVAPGPKLRAQRLERQQTLWKSGSLSSAVLHGHRCALLALELSERLHN